MPKFMLILADNPSSFQDVPPAMIQEIVGKYIAWTQKIKNDGVCLAGEKLCDEGGRRIKTQGQKPVVADGPFAESKEVLGGYYVIKAKDYDEAVKVALTCPHVQYGAYLDVRQIDEV